jgi:hypothetical protein
LPADAKVCGDEQNQAFDPVDIGEKPDLSFASVSRPEPRLVARKGQEKGKVPGE